MWTFSLNLKLSIMSKYILIPVKDIDEKIKGLENKLQTDLVKSHIAVWNTLKYYKEISLSEKDIEKKANLAWDENHPTERQAYKQALKDLK